MTVQSLMLFMKRILENGSAEKSSESLLQLENILRAQNADPAMVELVEKSRLFVSAAKEEANRPSFSDDSLRVMIKREEERKQREEQMSRSGRY